MEKGIKHDGQKPDLSQVSPEGLIQEALAMTYGKKKYGAYNWRGGLSHSRLIAAAMRHILAHMDGELNDPESGHLHIAHAKANLGMLLQMMKDRPELNDCYKKPEVQAEPTNPPEPPKVQEVTNLSGPALGMIFKALASTAVEKK